MIYDGDALWVKKILLPKGHLFKVLEPNHTINLSLDACRLRSRPWAG